MTEEGGWVKLYRSIRKWEWWEDINCYRLFTYCFMTANTAPRRWKGVWVGRGSFVTSYARLSSETALTVREVRTALEHLKSTNELTSRTTNRYTVITVCNYDRYQEAPEEGRQAEGHSAGQDGDGPAACKGQAGDNKQEYKKERNREEGESSPPMVGEDMPGRRPAAAPEIELVEGCYVDYPKLARYWNERTRGRFGRVQCIQNGRRKLVRARIRQYGKAVFKEAVDKVCDSEYLAAQRWFNFDWLVRPDNFDKVLAGNYDNKQTATKDGKKSTNDSRLGLGTLPRPDNKGMQTDI